MPSDPSRMPQDRRKRSKPTSTPPDTFSIGERVQISDTVKPKKYAGKRGEIESAFEGEFCVGGAWFKPTELVSV